MLINQDSQITDIPGILIGHSTNEEGQSGCTTILCPNGATAGVDVRGSAPGTMEIEVLKPVRLVPEINGLFFTGGSALGLPAVKGVHDFLREKRTGYNTGNAKIPIVPAAVIYDINENKDAIPDSKMAYDSAKNASNGQVQEGTIGVGIGATIGNIFGLSKTQKGGVATLAEKTPDGINVGVFLVVNAFGGIYDPWNGEWVVGDGNLDESLLYQKPDDLWQSNTTLIAIATDASLSKEQCIKVAEMAQDGLARVVYPAHTLFDGDLSVTLSVGDKSGEINGIGHLAAELVSKCILRAVELAHI